MTNVFCCPLNNLLTIIIQFFQILPQFRSVHSNRIVGFDIEHWRERFFEVKADTDSQGNTIAYLIFSIFFLGFLEGKCPASAVNPKKETERGYRD